MLDRRLALTLAAGALARPAFGQAPPRLVFTAIPDQDETRLVERFGRVASYLQDALGVAVTYVPVKSYPAAVTAFTNNQVQLAWFGGLTSSQARHAVPGSEVIAQGVEDANFRSYFIAHAGTGLARSAGFPEGIAGRSFSFGSRASTSGRVMPEHFIRRHFNRAPDQVFSRVGFSSDHSRTIQVVQSGAFEVGALDYTVYELERQLGRLDSARVAVIWETPPFPNYSWTIRGDVDARFGPGFKERVRSALVGIGDPAILSLFPRERFVPAANADYAPMEAAARGLGVLD
ncbi:MAG TPA: putative selenate ABC transporter substrate-binding protein [Falsiroseomonas sp.]|jgi:phosphonate transport system substrate-binding protein|nr:putative selenate ABC transporter substrate-binding protein [Falsiroseomonas sp.]